MIQLQVYNVTGIRVHLSNHADRAEADAEVERLKTESYKWSKIETIDFDTRTILATWQRPVVEIE